jgi:hypothetical protein
MRTTPTQRLLAQNKAFFLQQGFSQEDLDKVKTKKEFRLLYAEANNRLFKAVAQKKND